MKILELFGGIGACSKALERIGVDYEIADYVEIDKYAVKSFNALHGTNFEPQDIKEWDKDIKVDLIMHGSPCQDFSVAGKNAGGDKGSGTRSSLMYETLRIVEKLKPKYVIWENVKNLLGKKHKHNFDAYIEAMSKLGYVSKYQILNARDYGVPQNRERVFTVSCRHDGDSQIMGSFLAQFNFPEPIPLDKRLKDVLEDNVDERYYLSDEQVSKIKLSKFNQEHTRIQEGDVSQTILSRDYKDPKCVRVGGLYDKGNQKHQAGAIYDPNGLCATLSTMQGGNREPIIVASRGRGDNNEQQLEPNFSGTTNTLTSVQKDNYVAEPTELQKEVCNKAIEKGLVEPNDAIEYTYSNARLKEIEKGYIKTQNRTDNQVMSTLKTNPQQIGVVVSNDVSKTVRTGGRGSLDRHSWDIVTEPIKVKTANIKGYDEANDGDAIDLQYPESKTRRGRVGHGVSKTLMTSDQMAVVTGYRIRKLTPLECWRLMGFDDDDFYKAAQVNSNTQLYKQAGNSIVVNVLEGILTNLLKKER